MNVLLPKQNYPGVLLPRKWFFGLALVYTFFVVYGSLVPFNLSQLPLEQALTRFQALLHKPLVIHSRSDLVANVLLFAPFSFFWVGAFCKGLSRTRLILIGALVWLGGLALGLALEFGQLYVLPAGATGHYAGPARVSSLTDILAQSIGSAMGILVWVFFGPTIARWFRGFDAKQGLEGIALRLLPAYLVFLIMVNLLPFDLTLSPAEIYRKFRDGTVHPIPFTARPAEFWNALYNYAWTIAYFLPVGLFLSQLYAKFWQDLRDWPRVLLVGLLLTAAMEGLHLFVMQRHVDSTDIVLGGLSVLVGWAAPKLFRVYLSPRTSRESPAAIWVLNPPQRPYRISPLLWVSLLFCWFGLIVLQTWRPFNFVLDLDLALARIRQIPVMPLWDYFQGNYLNALDQFVQKTLVYLPLGIFFAVLFKGMNPKAGFLLLLIIALCLTTLMELGQAFLPGRYPSYSDIYVQTGGALAGFFITRRIMQMTKANTIV